MEEQAIILYAGVKGYLMNIANNKIGEYQSKLLSFIRNSYADVIEAIRGEKDLSSKTEEKLKQALVEFEKIFNV